MIEKIRWRVWDRSDGTYLPKVPGAWTDDKKQAMAFDDFTEATNRANRANLAFCSSSIVVDGFRLKPKPPTRGAAGRINDLEQRLHNAEALNLGLKQTIGRMLAGRLTDAEHAAVSAMVADVAVPTSSPWCPTCVGFDGEPCERHVPKREKSCLDCEHANENPNICPCDDNCYCRDKTCKGKPLRNSRRH